MSSFLLTSSQKQHRKVTRWQPTSSWQEAGSHLTAGWGVCPEKLGFPGLLVKPGYYFAWKITLGSNTGWTSSTKTLLASEMNRWAARACQLQVAHCERSTDVAAPRRHSSPTKWPETGDVQQPTLCTSSSPAAAVPTFCASRVHSHCGQQHDDFRVNECRCPSVSATFICETG